MSKKFLIILFLLCSIFTSKAQKFDSLLSEYAQDRHYDTLTYTSCENKKWVKNIKTKTFENQGKMHSFYFIINDDSTFVFQAFYEPGIDMSIGKWEKKNDSLLVLNWNKTETIEAFINKKTWKKYSKDFSGFPFKIENWIFIIRDSILVPITRKDEILSTTFH